MKKILSPAIIVIASILYFLIASAALAQDPGSATNPEKKTVKYCTTAENGKFEIRDADGKQVTEPIAFQNGAVVSTDGIIRWKDGSTSSLYPGDCIGVDNLGAVYVAKASADYLKNNPGITSNR